MDVAGITLHRYASDTKGHLKGVVDIRFENGLELLGLPIYQTRFGLHVAANEVIGFSSEVIHERTGFRITQPNLLRSIHCSVMKVWKEEIQVFAKCAS